VKLHRPGYTVPLIEEKLQREVLKLLMFFAEKQGKLIKERGRLLLASKGLKVTLQKQITQISHHKCILPFSRNKLLQHALTVSVCKYRWPAAASAGNPLPCAVNRRHAVHKTICAGHGMRSVAAQQRQER
jgi:hypothetical protein